MEYFHSNASLVDLETCQICWISDPSFSIFICFSGHKTRFVISDFAHKRFFCSTILFYSLVVYVPNPLQFSPWKFFRCAIYGCKMRRLSARATVVSTKQGKIYGPHLIAPGPKRFVWKSIFEQAVGSQSPEPYFGFMNLCFVVYERGKRAKFFKTRLFTEIGGVNQGA